MFLDLGYLRQAAALINDDLSRTEGPPWRLEIDEDLSLFVVKGDERVPTAFDREVEDDSWPLRETAPEDLEEMLRDYATERIFGGLSDILWSSRARWPICPEHPARDLGVCLGVWYCEGRHSVDLGLVGNLEAADWEQLDPPTPG